MNIRVQDWGGKGATPGIVTPDDLQILRGELFAGDELEADEIHVRRMLLCHDQYDRTYERFTKDMLKRFAGTIPGKSVLPNHDTGGWLGGGSLPLARFYAGKLQRRTEDDFPVLRRGRARGQNRPSALGVDIPPGFDAERVAVTYLLASFYFPNHESTESLRVHVDTGVYKWVSIGFRYDDIECDICKKSYLRSDCPHYLGGYDPETGELCTGTYSGNMEFVEALEGSFVYLGGQPRARNVKAMVASGTVDPARLAATPWGEDLVALKDAERLAREYGHLRKVFPAAKPEESEDSAPVGGLSLSDEVSVVLSTVGDLVTRTAAVRDLRASSGKRIGTGTLQRIQELSEALADFGKVLQDGDEPTEEGAKAEETTPVKDLRSAAAAQVILAEAESDARELGL